MLTAMLLAATFHLPLQTSDAMVGMQAENLTAGGECLARPHQRFPMGGLAAVPVAMEVLRRADAPELEPLLDRAVRLNDAAALARLLRRVGARAVDRRMAALGVPEIRVDRGTATPAAMERLFEAIARGTDGLSQQSNGKLLLWMKTSTGSSRIAAALPPGEIAHAEATMPGATADAVIFEPQNVAVIFTKRATSPPRGVERDIAALTHAMWDWMDQPTALSALAYPLPKRASNAVLGVASHISPFGSGWCEREEESFPMGGLAALPVAMEVLHRADEPELEALLERAVRLDDAVALARLLRRVGPRAVDRRMAALGVPEICVERGTATPSAMQQLLTDILRHDDGLSDAGREKLLRWMATSAGTSRIAAALPPGARLAHLEGTSPGATSDVAIVDGRRVIVVFTKRARSPRQDVERDIAAVAGVVWSMMDYVSSAR